MLQRRALLLGCVAGVAGSAVAGLRAAAADDAGTPTEPFAGTIGQYDRVSAPVVMSESAQRKTEVARLLCSEVWRYGAG